MVILEDGVYMNYLFHRCKWKYAIQKRECGILLDFYDGFGIFVKNNCHVTMKDFMIYNNVVIWQYLWYLLAHNHMLFV